MLTCIKRSGKKEDFSLEKVRRSLAGASDDAKQPMNTSDINQTVEQLAQIVEGKDSVTTQQISVIMAGLLYTSGYKGVLEAYLGHRKK